MDISEVVFEFAHVEALADEKVAAVSGSSLLIGASAMHCFILLRVILSLPE